MHRALLLHIVVGERVCVLQLQSQTQTDERCLCRRVMRMFVRCATNLFACEDETLLAERNALAGLDLLLELRDPVRWIHVQRDRLAGQHLHEDLHGHGGGRDKDDGGQI